MSSDNLLRLGAINSKVSDFKKLVENAAGKASTTIDKVSAVTELNKDLYDTAVNLPEYSVAQFKNMSMDKISDYLYGRFKGGSTYTKSGNIENSNVKEQLGWIILDNQSPQFVYFKNNENGNCFYIRFTDFLPEAIVQDFLPLYDVLNKYRFTGDTSIINDTKGELQLLMEDRDSLADAINENDSFDAPYVNRHDFLHVSFEGKESSTYFDTTYSNRSVRFDSIYPKMISTSKHEVKDNSVYNNVQAVIYDLPGYKNLGNNEFSITDSINQLFCYQQPDSISYTSSAQFDSPTTRGTQQPFQFYVQNNSISLGFSLSWHIDEIRTLLKKDGKTSYTIQDIADIAESFTRPWTTGNSVQPKLCKVILPGISEIGYITQAQISYSGSMSGDYTTNSGVLTSGSSNIPVATSIYNYFYSQITINFEITIVKDIKLHYATEQHGIAMSVNDREDIGDIAKNEIQAQQAQESNVNLNTDLTADESKTTSAKSGEITSYKDLVNNVFNAMSNQSIESGVQNMCIAASMINFSGDGN